MAAAKGNQYKKGLHFGRSKQFSSAEELQKLIDAYFKECDERSSDYITKKGEVVVIKDPVPYTIEGLACSLDCTRNTLLNYQAEKGYEDFFSTIARAKEKILKNKLERGLEGKSPSQFAIFDLVNNSDYSNKSETDITSKGEKVNSTAAINLNVAGKVIDLSLHKKDSDENDTENV